MESSGSETELSTSPSKNRTYGKSTNVRYQKDSEERSTYVNTQSSDSGVSTSSELSSCEEGIAKRFEESQERRDTSAKFLQNLLPWTRQKSVSKISPVRNQTTRGIEKIGGTLALIQYPRPSNLPVKSAAEDRRHRKQYDVILEEVRKREIREEQARTNCLEKQLKREDELSAERATWCNNILPKFESLRDTKKVRKLWWHGLPPSVRGKIWKLGIGNDLNISSDRYFAYADESTINEEKNETVMAIKLDVSRTFSNLGVFQEGGPLYEILRRVLEAYTKYRSDVGYVQGMSFLGAILTLNMEPNDAFVCFANLLNKPCHKAAFTLNQRQMNIYYGVFSSALAHKIPKIHLHFCSTGLSPDLYLLDWLYTVYAKAMPLDVACRIWDVFIRDGDEFLFRTALGILRMYQDVLLGMDFVRCSQFLTKLPDNLEASVLFENIGKMSTSIGARTFHEMISQLS